MFFTGPSQRALLSRGSGPCSGTAFQRFRASSVRGCPTMRVQPAVGTQPYGPEGNPMGLTVRMLRPRPDRPYTREPRRGRWACGITRRGAVVDPHWGCTKGSHGPALSRTPLSHAHAQHWHEGSLTGIFLSCTGANNRSTPNQGIAQGTENMPWPLTCLRIVHSTTVWAARL